VLSIGRISAIAGLFLDLKKAFDTIDHVILLKKLNTIGVRGVAAELLRNYLTNRLQTVCWKVVCLFLFYF
jgi:hypothetical protein